MNVTSVEITLTPEKERVKAMASVKMDDEMILNGVKLVHTGKRLCVEFPKPPHGNLNSREYVVLLNSDIREKIEKRVIEEYRKIQDFEARQEYRGIDKKSNRWVFGCLIAYSSDRQVLIPKDQSADSKMELYEIIPETLGFNSGRRDFYGFPIFQGDVLESQESRSAYFRIGYGEHPAYCSMDEAWMTNIGFYAENRLGKFPIGETEKWAKLSGNVIDSPNLNQFFEKQTVSTASVVNE